MQTQQLQKTLNNSRGATYVEFVIIFSVSFLLILGVIDYSRYLYIDEYFEFAAHDALTRASWVPHLESSGTERDTATNSIAQRATSYLQNAKVLSGGVQLKSGNAGKPYIVNLPTLQHQVRSSDFYGNNASAAGVVIGLPADIQENGLLPIGIRVNGSIRRLIPFLPDLELHGEAWGYREPRLSSVENIPKDCSGQPFNPRNPPCSSQCSCGVGQGVDATTGQCGCSAQFYSAQPPPADMNCPGGDLLCQCDADLVAAGDPSAGIAPCPDKNRIDMTTCTCAEPCPYEWVRHPDKPDHCTCPDTLMPRDSNGALKCQQLPCPAGAQWFECQATNCTHQMCDMGAGSSPSVPSWANDDYMGWQLALCKCVCHFGFSSSGNNCSCSPPLVVFPYHPQNPVPQCGCPTCDTLNKLVGNPAGCQCECVPGAVGSPPDNCTCGAGLSQIRVNFGWRCCPPCNGAHQQMTLYVPSPGNPWPYVENCGCGCLPGYTDVDTNPGTADCRDCSIEPC